MYRRNFKPMTPLESFTLLTVVLIIFVPNFFLGCSGIVLAILGYKIYKAAK